jgi:hypothetical protein
MTLKHGCSAYSEDRCSNGFPTHPLCRSPLGWPREGQPFHYGPPFCMREEWCGETYDETGGKPEMPFAKEATKETEG